MQTPPRNHGFFIPCAVLICAALAGCNGSGASLATGLANAEAFAFQYRLLQPDNNGLYTLTMDLGSGCTDYKFNEDDLANALAAKQFPLSRNVGSGPVTVQAQITFDAISACQPTDQEVRYETADLSEPFTDANGNATRKRPHSGDITNAPLVTSELSPGGVMEVAVFGTKILGTTASRSNTPGPFDVFTAVEVSATTVGGSSGTYSWDNAHTHYVEANLKDVLTNPRRFTADFAFLAKKDPAADEILLVWDGEIVLRLDIED